jgi:hypothetical protein
MDIIMRHDEVPTGMVMVLVIGVMPIGMMPTGMMMVVVIVVPMIVVIVLLVVDPNATVAEMNSKPAAVPIMMVMMLSAGHCRRPGGRQAD